VTIVSFPLALVYGILGVCRDDPNGIAIIVTVISAVVISMWLLCEITGG
jgi:hypothetical protein